MKVGLGEVPAAEERYTVAMTVKHDEKGLKQQAIAASSGGNLAHTPTTATATALLGPAQSTLLEKAPPSPITITNRNLKLKVPHFSAPMALDLQRPVYSCP